jgi:hypothetical protein
MVTEWYLFAVQVFEADKLIVRLNILEADETKALEIAKSKYYHPGIEQVYIVQHIAKIFRQPITEMVWQPLRF